MTSAAVRPSWKFVFVAMAACLALLLTGERANAATLSPTAALEMSSVSISGNHVYWFQRRSRTPRTYREYERAPGRIVRRALDSNVAEVVYTPPVGSRISAFNVRGGRIAVGLASTRSRKGRTAIVELVDQPTGLAATTLVERFGGVRDGKCDAEVALLNIDPTGSIIVEDSWIEGRNGKCELARMRGQFRALNRDGSQTELSGRKSGWDVNPDNLYLPGLRSGPSDWYALDGGDEEFFAAGGLVNVRTGAKVRAPLALSELDAIEIAPDGRSLFDLESFGSSGIKYAITPSATALDDPRPIKRDGSIVWMHICGEKLLEISRRAPTRKSRRGGAKWNLYLRTLDGTLERRLPQRLRRATAFDTCTADTAVFHRGLRKRRVRQFTVPLG